MNNIRIMDSSEETRAYFVYCMEHIIASDGIVTSEEKDLVDSLKATLKVNASSSIRPKLLSQNEQMFLVRELFRISIVDLEYKQEEAEMIAAIAEDNQIPKVIYEASKKWAKRMLAAEDEYLDELSAVISK